MKNIVLLFLLCLGNYYDNKVMARSSLVSQAQFKLEDFSWLVGCWKNEKETIQREEQWSRLEGNTMLGIGRSVSNDQTIEFEFLRLHVQNGKILYTAIPSGQQETSFTLIKLTKSEAVFENLEHDFPQRVIYFKKSNDCMLVRIEGDINGKYKSVDFPFKSIKCY